MPRRPRKLVTPDVLVRQIWRRRWAAAVVTVVVLVLLAVLDQRGLLLYRGDDMARYDDRAFQVVRIVDGDTIDINAPDGDKPTTRLRLWGVDTPEKAIFGRPAEPYSAEATALTRQLADGQIVTLDLEPHRVRGHYGRLLAYVRLPDGTTLNERLISAGLTDADDRWPHRDLERYKLLEDEARKQRVGKWAGKRDAGEKSE